MQKLDIRKYSRKIHDACRTDEFYRLLDEWQCGAFDGGCLMVAEALKSIFGGELYVIWGKERSRQHCAAQHAIVRIGDLYLDGDGVSNGTQLSHRWETREYVDVSSLRALLSAQAMVDGGTPYCKKTIEQMQSYFKRELDIK